MTNMMLPLAGNLFDIFKHAVLIEAVNIFKPFHYFETHGGSSSYILKNGEHWLSSHSKVLLNCPSVKSVTVCDIDPLVIVQNPVRLLKTDGWEEAKYADMHYADLIFIDPFYKESMDYQKLITCFDRLKNAIAFYIPFCLTNIPSYPHVSMSWNTNKGPRICYMLIKFPEMRYHHTIALTERLKKILPFLAWALSASYNISEFGTVAEKR